MFSYLFIYKMHFWTDIYITKQNLISQLQLSSGAARGRIKRALKKGSLLLLKRGMYLNANAYLHKSDRVGLIEFIASKMQSDSYISLEYALQKHQMLLPSAIQCITSITIKQTANYKNFAGDFVYKNIKAACYFGFKKVKFRDKAYFIATKSKALFDYLYLKPEFGSRNEKYLYSQLFQKSPIRWENFFEEDFKQFDEYVWQSNSFKMMRLRRVIERYFENKKFDQWSKELLSH